MKTQDQKLNYCNTLARFLPENTVEYIADLILDYECHFKVSAKRKTKLGDYRFPYQGKGHRISVNGDLNMYSFLITTIHEFAHLTTYKKYKNKVLPHGQEWKDEFKTLFEPIFEQTELPTDIELALKNYLKNAKASSCTDEALYRVLRRYDKNTGELVEHLKMGEKFMLNNIIFEKGKKLRKYYLCTNINNKRQYRVLGMAEIQNQFIDE